MYYSPPMYVAGSTISRTGLDQIHTLFYGTDWTNAHAASTYRYHMCTEVLPSLMMAVLGLGYYWILSDTLIQVHKST